MISCSVCRGIDSLTAVAPEWSRILESMGTGVLAPDATSSLVWARALARTHLRNSEVAALLLSSGTETVGLFPFFRTRSRLGAVTRRGLWAITEAHAGRSGLLVSGNDTALVEALLRSAHQALEPWDTMVFGVTQGSPSHAAAIAAIRRLSLPARCIATAESPYIDLADSWPDVLASLPKKTRWTLRKGEKELSARGHLEYAFIDSPATAPAMLSAIYSIERRSWKEDSGTSITSHGIQQAFYEELVPLAAEAGILSGHILRLDGQPIAYVLGLAAGDGVFLDLKESFDSAYAEFSPGHVLKRFAMEKLIARGVRIYDFMGNCEPYKMRWTSKTYRRLTLILFNGSVRGHYFRLRARFSPGTQPVPETLS